MESHSKSEEAEEKLYPNWLELPREVTVSILKKLDAIEILQRVQRFVQGSSGLIDLQLINFNNNEYLEYATQRCTKIRRLRLVSGTTSDYRLCEAAKKLPLLEDLKISCCYYVSVKALHRIGECCHLLKSLKMNKFYMWSNQSMDNDDIEAMSIAENMVELRHLQLLGNRLTNKGLKAILDSCIHLESLDLRQCCNLDRKCSLGKRCTETFKDFRDPFDSFEYFDFDPIIWRGFRDVFVMSWSILHS